jgi:hypothetical protein
MDADYELEAHYERACCADERRKRRYRQIAAAKLSDWAPEALVRKLAENLRSTATMRKSRGYDALIAQPHPDCTNPSCPHCRPTEYHLQTLVRERMRLHRMGTHLYMRDAWRKISTQDRRGPLAGKRWAHGVDGDGICGLLLTEIGMQLNGDFAHLPKQSAAKSKKTAKKVAGLARKLIEAIGEHEGGPTLAANLLGARFAVRNVARRMKDGEDPPAFLAFLSPRVWPSLTYEPDQREPGYDDAPIDLDEEPLHAPAWKDLPAVDRLRWLCGEVRETGLCDLLTALADEMDEQAEAKPQISRPDSGDPRVRVLVKALSEWMRGWYDNPLHDVVGCFVCAILDLREPLTRDDIRPILKRTAGA